MTNSGGKLTGLVADADVLIDYAQSDKKILALISTHLAPVCIPMPVLDDEVNGLTRDDVRQLGIEVIEPTLAQAIDAEKNIGATSLNDNLCMMLARDNNWAVLTNDNALRKICKASGMGAGGHGHACGKFLPKSERRLKRRRGNCHKESPHAGKAAAAIQEEDRYGIVF